MLRRGDDGEALRVGEVRRGGEDVVDVEVGGCERNVFSTSITTVLARRRSGVGLDEDV